MENQEIYYIEESQVWTCPIGGRWKAICVGGGASGGLRKTGNSARSTGAMQFSGGTTSFGAVASAAGGEASGTQAVYSVSSPHAAGGYGGYDGWQFGGLPNDADADVTVRETINGGLRGMAGHGYGAGGGAVQASLIRYITTGSSSGTTTSADTAIAYPISGFNGEMRATIVSIDEGEQIPCTIGLGGRSALTEDDEEMIVALVKALGGAYSSMSAAHLTANVAAINEAIVAGRDGVIILQYLGA